MHQDVSGQATPVRLAAPKKLGLAGRAALAAGSPMTGPVSSIASSAIGAAAIRARRYRRADRRSSMLLTYLIEIFGLKTTGQLFKVQLTRHFEPFQCSAMVRGECP